MRYGAPRNFSANAAFSREKPPRRDPVDPRHARARMVREQIASRGIVDDRVLNAMRSVPRHLFVPEALYPHAYEDRPLPIGCGQTISQPYTVARMTDFLELVEGMRVLEIGSGCGYQAAVLAAMGCMVFGMERIPELFRAAGMRLRRLGVRGVHLHRGDGTLGMPWAAPFERILVSAGGPSVPPPLVEQLADDGILLIPVGPRSRSQRLLRIRKQKGEILEEDMGPAVFVDLVGDHGW